MLKILPIPYTKIQARGAQLEMPKKRNQLKKEIDQFLSLLASQLAESYSNSLDNEASLKDLFEDSLTTLPDCLLKQDLQTNFETHYEELKGHLQELVSKPVLKSSSVDSSENIISSSTITSNEWVCSTTSIADIQQVLLNIESSDYKDITMYQKLAFSARWSGIGLGLILKHWSQSLMTSSFKEITTAIEFCSRAVAADRTLLLCLEFYIDILTHIVTEKDDTCHKELVNVLFSVLLSSHYTYQSQISSAQEQHCYDNHFAALLSFYIELCLLTRDHVTCVNLSDVLHVFSGNNAKIALDAILQVTMAIKMANASFVLSLICSILCSVHIQSIIVDPPFYLSILCCKHQGHHFASCDVKDLNLIRKLESIHNIPIPATLNEWIWETNPKVCVQLGLKREWSCDQLHCYLTTDLNQTQVDLLLDLVTGHHESEAASLNMDIDKRGKENDDITLCNITQSSFFIDNEGDKSIEEDIEDCIFCSKSDTNIDKSVSTWDQSLITTTTTALPVVAIATSNKEHVDNADLLKESLEDVSSLCKQSMTSHEQRNGFYVNHNTDDIQIQITYPQISTNKDKIIEDAPVIESLVTPVQKSSDAKRQTSSSKRKAAILKRLRKSGSLTPPTLNNISPKLLRSTVKRRLNIIK